MTEHVKARVIEKSIIKKGYPKPFVQYVFELENGKRLSEVAAPSADFEAVEGDLGYVFYTVKNDGTYKFRNFCLEQDYEQTQVKAEKDSNATKKIWIAACVFCIIAWIITSVASAPFNNRVKEIGLEAAASYERMYGPVTSEKRTQAEKDLRSLSKDYDSYIRALNRTSSGDDYLLLLTRIGNVIKDYNHIAFYKYYYWPDGRMPGGLPESLKEPKIN